MFQPASYMLGLVHRGIQICPVGKSAMKNLRYAITDEFKILIRSRDVLPISKVVQLVHNVYCLCSLFAFWQRASGTLHCTTALIPWRFINCLKDPFWRPSNLAFGGSNVKLYSLEMFVFTLTYFILLFGSHEWAWTNNKIVECLEKIACF